MKKNEAPKCARMIGVLVCTVFFLFFFSDQTIASTLDDRTVYYAFDEAGDHICDEWNDPTYDATIVGSLSSITDSPSSLFGAAMSAAYGNNRCSLPGIGDALWSPGGSDPLSISVWMRTTAHTNDMSVYSYGYPNNYHTVARLDFDSSNKLRYTYMSDLGVWTYWVSDSSMDDMRDGQWHNIISQINYDVVEISWGIWVDGVPVSGYWTGDTSDHPYQDANYGLNIKGDWGVYTYAMDVDDFVFYPKYFSEVEIAGLQLTPFWNIDNFLSNGDLGNVAIPGLGIANDVLTSYYGWDCCPLTDCYFGVQYIDPYFTATIYPETGCSGTPIFSAVSTLSAPITELYLPAAMLPEATSTHWISARFAQTGGASHCENFAYYVQSTTTCDFVPAADLGGYCDHPCAGFATSTNPLDFDNIMCAGHELGCWLTRPNPSEIDRLISEANIFLNRFPLAPISAMYRNLVIAASSTDSSITPGVLTIPTLRAGSGHIVSQTYYIASSSIIDSHAWTKFKRLQKLIMWGAGAAIPTCVMIILLVI
jgi:hypothetical protein